MGATKSSTKRSSIQVTDATPTVIQELVIPRSSMMMLTIMMDGVRNNSSFGISEKVMASFLCNGSDAVSQNGSTVYVFRKRLSSAWLDLSFNVATANKVIILVTGIAGLTINFQVKSMKNIVRVTS